MSELTRYEARAPIGETIYQSDSGQFVLYDEHLAQREQDRKRIEELEEERDNEARGRQIHMDEMHRCLDMLAKASGLPREQVGYEPAISTLTQALAQARGALEKIDFHLYQPQDDPTTADKYMPTHREIELCRECIEQTLAALDVPAAGGGVKDELEDPHSPASQAVVERWLIAASKGEAKPGDCLGILHQIVHNAAAPAPTPAIPVADLQALAPLGQTYFKQAVMERVEDEQCIGCDVGIGTHESHVKAATEHDATPGLVWTTERPTVPGWYWHQDKAMPLSGDPCVIQVSHIGLRTEWGDTAEFAGPLPEPLQGA